jgi:H+/Cl- antiporter ClcA
MGALTFIALAVGVFVAGLIGVAMIVAGWELLRQREQLDALRRDRAVYAATSPLPLAPAAGARPEAPRAAPPGVPPPVAAPAVRREPHWIETRPMVLCTPAVDDETRPPRRRDEARQEPDLLLD